LCCGENFLALVGPNKEMIGTLLNDNICMTPLSIVIAKSSLVPRQVTKAGELREVSYSGNKADGMEFLIFIFSSSYFFSIKKTGILLFLTNSSDSFITLLKGHSFFL